MKLTASVSSGTERRTSVDPSMLAVRVRAPTTSAESVTRM